MLKMFWKKSTIKILTAVCTTTGKKNKKNQGIKLTFQTFGFIIKKEN